MFHLLCCHHPAAVEPVARELHYPPVHTVLHGEQRHHFGLVLHDALHERLGQSAAHRLQTLHCGRQLTVVSGEHHPRRTSYGYPTGGFERLCRLIDEERGEFLSRHHPVGAARQRGCYHLCLAEELCIDATFYLRGTALQAVELLVEAVRVALPSCPQLAYRLAYAP